MSNVILAVSDFFGIIMRWIYTVVNNYGITIVLFTALTKLFLLPISMLTQKNSIKMAQMRPELDALKIKYVDDKDKYVDSQVALYKKMNYHPLLDILPLICQLVIVLGLVGVMYRPLTYILNISENDIEALRIWLQQTEHSVVDSSYQIEIVNRLRNINAGIDGVSGNTMEIIKNFNMDFCGIDLTVKPSIHSKLVFLIVPLLSALSTWAMCEIQNRINILQLYAGKWNKIGMTIFLIAFSTYFTFLVPAGVGIYWICGNLFAIPLMYLTNCILPPGKYVDLDYVRITKKTAEKKEKYQKQFEKMERKSYKAFLHTDNKKLVFYSEERGFYKYYAPIIDYIIEKSNTYIDYITSDPEDPILQTEEKQIRAYYVAQDKFLIPLFMRLDCAICIMTMPDLQKYHIKRSKVRNDIEYIYVTHGVGSNALTLRKGALDYYDTVFCVGIDTVIEIRQMEELYHTAEKTLVETGYVLLDQMIEDYQKQVHVENERKKILIAPSWQPDNIIDLCIEEILKQLKETNYEIIVRPHPQQVRHQKEKFDEMKKRYEECDNIEIQTDFSSNFVVMNADVLITDWSDISFEYAFTTLKPVLFIDTPMKVMNPEYDRIAITPINFVLRNVIGKSISVDKCNNIIESVQTLLDEKYDYQEVIAKAREEHIFNVGKSKILSGKYILRQLKE